MKFVEVNNLSITYLGNIKPSLTVDHLEIEEGEAVLIVGRSGSGKSTLVNAINGVIPHLIRAEEKGEVIVFGNDVKTTPIHKMSKYVGTLLQDPESQVFNYKVIDEVAFGPENLMYKPEEIRERVYKSLKVTGISHLAEREINKLSGGELQRTVLASILALDPKALILDEPTSNIDPEGTKQVFDLLRAFREERRSLIIVEHKVDRVLPYVDRVILVNNGKIELDIHKDEIIEYSEKLSSEGIEIPEHYLYLKKVGGKRFDEELLKGYKHSIPNRRNGKEEVFYSKVKVYTKEGIRIVDTELRLKGGQIVALMGRNGAGKSTLLKAIAGVLDRKLKSDVRIIVNGEDISKKHIIERGKYVAYLPQNFDLIFVKRRVKDEIAFTMKNHKVYSQDRLNHFLKIFSLEKIKEEDPLILSMGQRRRVAMASVLASGAKIILMDEPTSGQDWYHREMLGKELLTLRDMGYSILVVTHDSRFVDKFCDLIYVMSNGEIVRIGKPEELFVSEGTENLGIYPPTEYEVMRNHSY